MEDYTCNQKEECQTNCIRKTNYLSQKWFSGWLDGEPELKEECKYYLTKKSLIDELL